MVAQQLQPKEAFPKAAFQETVQEFPQKSEVGGGTFGGGALTFYIGSVADSLPVWGLGNVKLRDVQLREFWKSESMLAGAVNAVCARNSAFEWEIKGPDKTVEIVTRMLQGAIVGNERGWIPFIQAVSQDLYTTDNGAFIELIRMENKPTSPVIGIGHLDSVQCVRTGNPDVPVIYEDTKGNRHKMPWWAVVALAELPSPIQKMRGVGFCSVSRVLRHAQLLKNLAVYKNEKVSGRFYRAIHFVGGVSKREIDDIMARGQEDADNTGLTRYIMPQIIASLDPEKPVTTATIDLASLPDGFDLDKELKWYITSLAMGFGVDYQDFAPLPGGNLGTSTQSEVLHRKSSAKGPAVFMQTLQNIFHFYGVLPQNAKFAFHEKDLAFEAEQMTIKKLRGEMRAIQIRSGEITPQVARDMALRDGDMLPEEHSKIEEDYGLDMLLPDRSFSNGDQNDTSSRKITRGPREAIK